MRSILAGFRNIFNFRGRLSRGEFWPFALTVYFGFFVVGTLFLTPEELYVCNTDPSAAGTPGACTGTASQNAVIEELYVNLMRIEVLIFALLASAITRRLHDVGKSAGTALAYIVVELSLLAFTSLNTEELLSDGHALYFLLWLARPYTIFSNLFGLYLLYLLVQRGEPYFNRYDTDISLEQIKAMREELTAEASESELRSIRARLLGTPK